MTCLIQAECPLPACVCFGSEATLAEAYVVGREMGVLFKDQPPETSLASYEGNSRFSASWVVDGWMPSKPFIDDPN